MKKRMVTKHVVVLPYDEQWGQDFINIKAELTGAIGQLALRIEHVGSTIYMCVRRIHRNSKDTLHLEIIFSITRMQFVNTAISKKKEPDYIPMI